MLAAGSQAAVALTSQRHNQRPMARPRGSVHLSAGGSIPVSAVVWHPNRRRHHPPSRFDEECLRGAVFFPVHDSEQRHAAHCNHRPCRWLGHRRNSQCEGPRQPSDEAGVNGGSRGGELYSPTVLLSSSLTNSCGWAFPATPNSTPHHRIIV
jgi:hypothetical protein